MYYIYYKYGKKILNMYIEYIVVILENNIPVIQKLQIAFNLLFLAIFLSFLLIFYDVYIIDQDVKGQGLRESE